MDDMMKDVINRGTAAQAGAWGFKNVPGQRAFAGKTGTSRDGWFAGFTPELVCVVYVGFDDGGDLGMKGADSAMPIWADFMQKALRKHPEWNADWVAPPNVRKAEIDTRNGSLIREIDPTAAEPSPTPTPTPYKPSDPELQRFYPPEPPQAADVFVSNVPAEFRRIELFIAGTQPMKAFANPDQEVPAELPAPSPTPLSETWEDAEPPGDKSGLQEVTPTPARERGGESGMVTVTICPVSGKRANSHCPIRELRSYQAGTEPKAFCTFHR